MGLVDGCLSKRPQRVTPAAMIQRIDIIRDSGQRTA
jgi:hypothetical protein